LARTEPDDLPLIADVPAPAAARLGTRTLLVLVGTLLVLLGVGLVVALVLLHQPGLTPVPVPSVSQL
jgi:hypothetical protein